jgi:hypothetical protein
VALTCTACGVKLFGAEVAAGLCEHCQALSPEARDRAAQEKAARHLEALRGPPPERGRVLRPEWATFGLGLRLMRAAVALYLLLHAARALLLLLAVVQRDPGLAEAGQVPRLITAAVAALVWLAGLGLCCAAPAAAGLRLPAGACLACTALAYLALAGIEALVLTGHADARLGEELSAVLVLGVAAVVLGLAGLCLLAVVGRVAAFQLGDSGLAARFLGLLIVLLVSPFAAAALFFVALLALGAAFGTVPGIGLSVLLGVCGGVLFAFLFGLWLLALLSDLIGLT